MDELIELLELKNSRLNVFLLKNNIRNEFLENTKLRSSPDYSEDFKESIESHDIDSSFTWANTPEGHDFWENLQTEYSDFSEPISEPEPKSEYIEEISIFVKNILNQIK